MRITSTPRWDDKDSIAEFYRVRSISTPVCLEFFNGRCLRRRHRSRWLKDRCRGGVGLDQVGINVQINWLTQRRGWNVFISFDKSTWYSLITPPNQHALINFKTVWLILNVQILFIQVSKPKYWLLCLIRLVLNAVYAWHLTPTDDVVKLGELQ